MARKSVPPGSRKPRAAPREPPKAEAPPEAGSLPETVKAEIERAIDRDAPETWREARIVQVEVRPVPSPADLRDYEALYPGAAGIFIQSYVKEQDARIEARRENHALAMAVLKAESRYQFIGLVALALVIAGACFLGWLGSPTNAVAFVAACAAATAAGGFIRNYATKKGRPERGKRSSPKSDA